MILYFLFILGLILYVFLSYNQLDVIRGKKTCIRHKASFLMLQQQHGSVALEQSYTLFFLKGHGCGGFGWGLLQMWKVGFWLHWQLWGTKVSQSRKWLDLPCGRLAHPDKKPHSSEHPGSPQAPTEDYKERAELLVKMEKNLHCRLYAV